MKRILIISLITFQTLFSQSISRLEYFVDTDQGVGSASALSVTSGASVDENINIPLTGLAEGFHYVGIRARDDVGVWSLTTMVSFLSVRTGANISALEYFIDTDQGVGSATTLPVTSGADVDENINIPLTSLGEGFHYVGIRARDDIGVWSLTTMVSFLSVRTGTNVTALEYFVDDDPGQGSANTVAITSGDSINVNFEVPLSGLDNGIHLVGFRTRDDLGRWSLTNMRLFLKEVVPMENIVACEYYIDADPGLGNGAAVTIVQANTIDASVTIDLGPLALTDGFHSVGIRTKNNLGQWSMSTVRTFLKTEIQAAGDIVACEYFVDTDPGIGSGISVTISQANSIDTSVIIDLGALALDDGLHSIGIRTKDESGRWSLTQIKPFLKAGIPVAGDIVACEYFIDTDPGFGSGTAVTIIQADTIDTSVTIDLSALTLADGFHSVGIRTKDDGGEWSLATLRSFVKSTPDTAGNITALEYYFTDSNETPTALVRKDDFAAANNIDVEFRADLDLLTVDETYTLHLEARDDNNLKSHQVLHEFTVVFDTVAPAVPQLSTTKELGTITLHWSPNTEEDFYKYNLYRDISSPATTLLDSIVEPAVQDTFYVDNNIAGEQTYYYRMTSHDYDGNVSDYSDELTVYPAIIVSTSPAQNALAVVADANIQIEYYVDMNGASFDASTFIVQASQTGLHTGSYNYNSGTKTASFNPDDNFIVGEVVNVTLTTGVQFAAGDTIPKPYGWSFTIAVDDGSGVFTVKSTLESESYSYSVFSADLDSDGDQDLATANYSSDNVSVLLNNGDGTFAVKTDYTTGSRPWSVFSADLDGDGDLDLATANYSSDNVSVLLNNGDGTFAVKTDYTTGIRPWSVFSADLDGDGDQDLATANYSSDDVSVLLNNGDGTFAQKVDYATGSDPASVFSADLDGDGDLDLTVANYSSNNVSVLLNNGDGTFAVKTDYTTGSSPISVFSADLDGDADLDLAVANVTWGSEKVSVLLNNGDGTFQLKTDYSVGNMPRSIFSSDLDGDGDLDLMTANYNSNTITILLNNGDGTFQTRTDYTTGSGPYSVFSSDLDSDGDLDMAVTSISSNTVSVLLNRNKEADIAVSADSLEFGIVRIDSSGSLQFSVYNDGTEGTLEITDITSSNTVFVPDLVSMSIAPGDTGLFTVNFTPTAEMAYSDSLTIFSSDPNKSQVKLVVSGEGRGPVWHVTTSGSNSNDGTDSAPFATIQHGIDLSADGDTVLVHPGTYIENINFNGHNIVVGSLFLLTQDTSYISSTIIDGNQSGSVVTFESSEDSSVKIIGFNIINGSGSDISGTLYGGGVFISNSNPSIYSCYIQYNSSHIGGGVSFINNSSGEIKQSRIINNTGFGGGAGIACVSSSPLIQLTNISNNVENGWNGGGLYLETASPQIINCIITNNVSGRYGGGIYAYQRSNSVIINSSIVNNNAGESGDGVYLIDETHMKMINDIIWSNDLEQISFSSGWNPCSLSVAYSDIQDSLDGIHYTTGEVYSFNGNIDTPPSFRDTNDFHINDYSLCIGAGIDSTQIDGTWYYAPTTDIDGNIRPNPVGSNPDMGAYESSRSVPLPPEAPTNLSISEGNTRLTLRWTASTAPSTDHYNIYRSTVSGFTPASVSDTIASVSVNDTSYLDQNLTNDTTYYYRVSAVDGLGNEGDYSTETFGTPHTQLYTVKTDGTGDYTVIQTAIDAMTDGDTVLVHPGTYVENINFNGHNIVVGSLFLLTQDTSYISSTIIDGNQSGSVVTFDSGEDTTAVLSGLIIQNGLSQSAGGIKIASSSPKLLNLVIKNNQALSDGGGLYLNNSGAKLINLNITNNVVGSEGGGLRIDGGSPYLKDNNINDNNANSGAGLTIQGGANVILDKLTIYNNSATNMSGALSTHSSTLQLINSLVYNNNANSGAGGLDINYQSDLVVINSTISNNEGYNIYAGNISNVKAINTIIYNPVSSNVITETFGVFTAKYSLISGSWNGEGNIDTNPYFVDSTNYHLLKYSSCIGAGADSVQIDGTWYYAPTTDISGNPRPNPAGSNPDMGAYESTLPSQRPKAGAIADGLTTDVDWWNSDISLSANWAPFADDSTVTYEYAIGTSTANLSDVLSWTDNNSDTSVIKNGLTLTEGSTYYFSVRGTDIHGQVSDTTTTDGITIDIISPVMMFLFEGSTSEDRDYQNSDSLFTLSWGGVDAASGIVSYAYSLGTSPGDSNIITWTNTDSMSSITISVQLSEGVTYFASARAIDAAGNSSSYLSGDGIIIDLTAPVAGAIYDGAGQDVTYTANDTVLSGHWDRFTDNISQIAYYEYCFGTNPGSADVIGWMEAGVDTVVVISGQTLQNGQTYYLSVMGSAGNRSAVSSSDGVTVDVAPPMAGIVNDGLTDDENWSNSATTLSGNWSGFSDGLSGIAYYEYAIGMSPGSSNVVDWTSVGLDATVTRDGLTLTSGVMYYFTVHAIDSVGNISGNIATDGIMIDLIDPLVGEVWEGTDSIDIDWQSSTTNLDVYW
ncbi:MAG: DUF1573 domain-containing protein, partial [FCB group bacterium]|nr:DUF1573 domain-containing protein [FCB group bacterium]